MFRSKKKTGGFLLLEMLISALILVGAVAASMYLFRAGFQYLEKIRENNLISSKVPQALSYIYKAADLDKGKGELLLGENVSLKWEATLIENILLQVPLPEVGNSTPYELYLYEVEFNLATPKLEKTYKTYVTKYKMLTTPETEF